MTYYVGCRSVPGLLPEVEVNGDFIGKCPLPLCLDLVDHPPTGFEWGYRGSGPAQLALAILAHATGHDTTALKFYGQFKEDYVSVFPKDYFIISVEEVCAWVAKQQ